jgi:hypothetical protein
LLFLFFLLPSRRAGDTTTLQNMAHLEVAGRGMAAKCRSASGSYGRSSLPGIFADRQTRSGTPIMRTRLLWSTDVAGHAFHVDSEERSTLIGRWSRHGREVPLGKRHLL